MTEEILLTNLRTLHKMLSPKYKSPDLLTELLIILAAAEQQFIDLYGDIPHPLLKVISEALTMCDLNKIRRHILKELIHYI